MYYKIPHWISPPPPQLQQGLLFADKDIIPDISKDKQVQYMYCRNVIASM